MFTESTVGLKKTLVSVLIVQAHLNGELMAKFFCQHWYTNHDSCLLAWALPSLQRFLSLI